MNPPHDGDEPFLFRTVFEYCAARAYARRRVDDDGRRFSSDKVFVNNGDTYNAKHIIRRLKDGRRRADRPDETDRKDLGVVPAAESSGLATLTGRRYETYLDRSSAAARAEYLRRSVGERPDRRAAETTTDDGEDDDDEDRGGGPGDATVTVLTTLRRDGRPTGAGAHLSGCEIVAKDGDDGAAWRSALMQCAAAVFDVSAGADDEVRDARAAFGHVRDELTRCSDEQLARWRDDGTVRCFVLVSTAMSWGAEESRAGGDVDADDPDGYDGEAEESARGAEETRSPLARAPVAARYRAVFELEKAVLRANSTRTRHVFRGRVIGVGVTYGHEQRALRRVFERAWLGDDADDGGAYAAIGRNAVPAVHVDELAELVRVACARGRRAAPPADDRAYALAVERPSYEYADVVDAVRDAFCARCSRADHDRRARKKPRRTVSGIFEKYDGGFFFFVV